VSLVLVFAVDADGNPLTQDFPNVVVVGAASSEVALVREDGDDDGKQRRARRAADRVVGLHRAPHQWTSVARRWHKSFRTDYPV